MAKDIIYLLVIIAAFFIILFSPQLNIVVRIICLITMAVGASVMIGAIQTEVEKKKNKKS